ncbi:hypothetical protein [Arthrobacter sp. B2a2-09]|uniref:hypothetical protein n=1 Tax=Arthrobacter sp. B2a2-09 TaxID=2952822 RepID=UPI0022CDBC34|nr:hypothetical protein [Arthrobacter sp. B2a2-09]MCZ9880198.1 hypothetical protein [Arthrobacter sp. B2a2-09]
MTVPGMPVHEKLLRTVLAIAILGGPLGYLIGGLLAPAIHISGSSTIDANTAVDPTANNAHLAAFVLASFLLGDGRKQPADYRRVCFPRRRTHRRRRRRVDLVAAR